MNKKSAVRLVTEKNKVQLIKNIRVKWNLLKLNFHNLKKFILLEMLSVHF